MVIVSKFLLDAEHERQQNILMQEARRLYTPHYTEGEHPFFFHLLVLVMGLLQLPTATKRNAQKCKTMQFLLAHGLKGKTHRIPNYKGMATGGHSSRTSG